MKLKDEDRKELYIKWKALLLSYIDFSQTIFDLEYDDEGNLGKYLMELNDLIIDIKDKYILKNNGDDEEWMLKTYHKKI